MMESFLLSGSDRSQSRLCPTPRRDRLSKIRTRTPDWFRSRSARFEPMKPAPPVIKAVREVAFIRDIPSLREPRGHDANFSRGLGGKTVQSQLLQHGLRFVVGLLFSQPIGELSESLFVA